MIQAQKAEGIRGYTSQGFTWRAVNTWRCIRSCKCCGRPLAQYGRFDLAAPQCHGRTGTRWQRHSRFCFSIHNGRVTHRMIRLVTILTNKELAGATLSCPIDERSLHARNPAMLLVYRTICSMRLPRLPWVIHSTRTPCYDGINFPTKRPWHRPFSLVPP